MEGYESYYYYEDEYSVTEININHFSRKVLINRSVDPDEVDESASMISKGTYESLLFGLINKYYFIQDDVEAISYDNELKRKFYYLNKISEKYANTDYSRYIEEEFRLANIYDEKMLNYYNLDSMHKDLISKIDMTKYPNWHRAVNEFDADENASEFERQLKLADARNEESFKNAYEELKKDPAWIESEKISKMLMEAFFEYYKASEELLKHFEKEKKEMYSQKYKEKIEEYANQGLFLYCLNTPDLPIDDDNVTIQDTYNHFIDDDCQYLFGTVRNYIMIEGMGKIYDREADDLIASLSLLAQGNYWAALRNLYSLIEHHHKLCADAMNGYFEEKEKYKNGKERSDKIYKLVDSYKSGYYMDVWIKLDSAIKEMNSNTSKLYPSRNGIIHGDYENMNLNPSANDVVNAFMIYITLRQIVEHFKNIEEIQKMMTLYMMGFLSNLEKEKK